MVLVANQPEIELGRVSADSFQCTIRMDLFHMTVAKINYCSFREFNYSLTIPQPTVSTTILNSTHSKSVCVSVVPWNPVNTMVLIGADIQFSIQNSTFWNIKTKNITIVNYAAVSGIRFENPLLFLDKVIAYINFNKYI